MSKFLRIAASLVLLGSSAYAEGLGLGRDALPEEIAAWNIDVRPGGAGLPAGSGDAFTGEEIFADKCASCHGDFAEGLDNWPKLAGGRGTLNRDDPVKTVGSYWPHLSTVWDYVNRSMPYGNAQSLQPDEVYALVAYILYSNDLVDDDFVLSDETFGDFALPNAGGFHVDDRAETEYAIWSGAPCMENCKDNVDVTMRAMVLDVTPTGEEEAATPSQDAPGEDTAEEQIAAPNPELVSAGEKVFRKCKACHQIGDGAKNRVGPVLTGIVGQPAGQVEGFKYSNALTDMADEGLVWDAAALRAFLGDPMGFMQGTKMSFAGLPKDEDLDAIAAYLASHPK
ncbi:c-type cytochrome [Roseovarius sp. M141]|uniref:c-type cytochrome n=1 Tax=Roseovarius sp. M141 TaxID=2583806 RepID=UPI0020CF2539|nr:c-type cytochrome [Roseovarius sp. M141]MCQ0091731.1 c-type cytochrome [Roseovarius sp. M141]